MMKGSTAVNFPALKGEAFSSPSIGLVQATQRWTSGIGYGNPEKRDILRSVDVRVTGDTTMPTAERLSRPPSDMQAPAAHLARVGRIDQNQRDACVYALVGDVSTQLIESPTVGPSPFGLAARLRVRAFPDPGQILQGDGAPGGCSRLDQTVTDGVVDLLLETSLASRQPLQRLPHAAAGTACAFRDDGLTTLPIARVAVTHGCDLCPTEAVAVAADGDIRSSQVHTQDTVCLPQGFFYKLRILSRCQGHFCSF